MGNPFSVLALKKSEMKHTPPFSRTWIKDHILAPGALNNLNQEAADVLLERQGLLERDAENSYLAMDAVPGGSMDQLLGHSITYRIAVGPQAGRKVITLQTLPACDPEEQYSDTAGS